MRLNPTGQHLITDKRLQAFADELLQQGEHDWDTLPPKERTEFKELPKPAANALDRELWAGQFALDRLTAHMTALVESVCSRVVLDAIARQGTK